MRQDSPGMGEFDFDALEERFLFELRDQVCAIDDQSIVHDRSPRSEADIVHGMSSRSKRMARYLSSIGERE